jgi:hypothetical protein
MKENATCLQCGAVWEFDQDPGYSLKPNICRFCDGWNRAAFFNHRLQAREARRFATLPIDDYVPALGNTTLLNRIVAAGDCSLYIVGPNRIGKTRSVCAAARRMTGDTAFLYVRWIDAVATYRTALVQTAGEADGYRRKLSGFYGVLIVDDVGLGKESERSAELLYDLADCRLQAGHTTWWTSNRTPDELADRFGPEYGGRIAGRIAESCRILKAEAPSGLFAGMLCMTT